jgi:tetratricopeptide (TPR) repeat protein
MYRCAWPLLLSAVSLSAQVTPEALIRDGHYKRALAMVEPRYRANPNDAETLWAMSHLKQVWKDLKASQELAEKAVAAGPKSARYHLRLAEAVGEEAQHAGKLHQFGLARRFKKEIDTVMALDPKNVDGLKFLMEYYFEAPGIMGGDKAKGRAAAEQIMRLDPVEGYFAQLGVARREKQEVRAEDVYRKAVEARPSSFAAHLALGNYYLGPGKKFSEAEAHGREAVKIEPGRVPGHHLLAGALASQDKWADLDAALAAGEQNVPDNLLPYFRAGNFCLVKGIELPRAERYLRKYLSQEPEPDMPTLGRAHWRLGLVLEKQGRKSEALAEVQTAVKMDSSLTQAKDDLKRRRSEPRP